MAEFVLKDAHVTINSVDLSDHVRQVTIQHGADLPDRTAMGDDSRRRLPGLKDWSATVEFNQDFDASKVDATLNGLVGAASFAVAFRPTSGATSATNPQYSGSALLESYPILSGAIGDAAVVSITLQGDGDLARATS